MHHRRYYCFTVTVTMRNTYQQVWGSVVIYEDPTVECRMLVPEAAQLQKGLALQDTARQVPPVGNMDQMHCAAHGLVKRKGEMH